MINFSFQTAANGHLYYQNETKKNENNSDKRNV